MSNEEKEEVKIETATAADFFSVCDKPNVESFYVEALDKNIYLKLMSGTLRCKVESLAIRLEKQSTPDNFVRFKTLLLLESVCDEKGNLIFGEKEIKKVIDNMPATCFEALIQEIKIINGFAERSIEEAEKN